MEIADVRRRVGAFLLAVAVALPLASWAAARAPILVVASVTASNHHSSALSVHRRVRRHRQTWGVASEASARAFAAGAAIPEVASSSRVVAARACLPSATDLPPPDQPPA
jgi:hypothetical protein